MAVNAVIRKFCISFTFRIMSTSKGIHVFFFFSSSSYLYHEIGGKWEGDRSATLNPKFCLDLQVHTLRSSYIYSYRLAICLIICIPFRIFCWVSSLLLTLQANTSMSFSFTYSRCDDYVLVFVHTNTPIDWPLLTDPYK